jgi:hypothetical protein
MPSVEATFGRDAGVGQVIAKLRQILAIAGSRGSFPKLMDVLGHSQLSITMDLYSHVMPSALRDAADAMDRALSGRSKDWQSMIVHRCCHRCCQSWFDGDH